MLSIDQYNSEQLCMLKFVTIINSNRYCLEKNTSLPYHERMIYGYLEYIHTHFHCFSIQYIIIAFISLPSANNQDSFLWWSSHLELNWCPLICVHGISLLVLSSWLGLLSDSQAIFFWACDHFKFCYCSFYPFVLLYVFTIYELHRPGGLSIENNAFLMGTTICETTGAYSLHVYCVSSSP